MLKLSSTGKILLLLFSFIQIGPVKSGAGEERVIIHEDFMNRNEWHDLYFPRISRHSVYQPEQQGLENYLKAESNAAASAIVHDRKFNVYLFSRARWRWKISKVYKKGTITSRKGDDYPVRIYIMFSYDPRKAGTADRIRYGIAKRVYGEYPPHSTLCYVWANREDEGGRVAVSPYSERAQMILLEKGMKKAGSWQREEVNILDDYRIAFGTDPPEEARISIMNDSDDTGESSVSYVDYLDVFSSNALP